MAHGVLGNLFILIAAAWRRFSQRRKGPCWALSRQRAPARDGSKEIIGLCCSCFHPVLSGFNSELAQCAAGDEVTLEIEGVVDR
jgi:hypothetical protein